MNKEELTTLLTPKGTSHCSCLEHCFLLVLADQCGGNLRASSRTQYFSSPGYSLNVPYEDFTQCNWLITVSFQDTPAPTCFLQIFLSIVYLTRQGEMKQDFPVLSCRQVKKEIL